MARRIAHGTLYQDILAFREGCLKVEHDAPLGKHHEPEMKAWLEDQPGEYDITTEPTMTTKIVTYRWWFSDDNVAFAFKMRWV